MEGLRTTQSFLVITRSKWYSQNCNSFYFILLLKSWKNSRGIKKKRVDCLLFIHFCEHEILIKLNTQSFNQTHPEFKFQFFHSHRLCLSINSLYKSVWMLIFSLKQCELWLNYLKSTRVVPEQSYEGTDKNRLWYDFAPCALLV